MTKEIFNEIVSNLFVKVYKRRPLIIENGSGSYLFTKNGNKYLDFISGISVNNLGYFNPNIQESITLNKINNNSNNKIIKLLMVVKIMMRILIFKIIY